MEKLDCKDILQFRMMQQISKTMKNLSFFLFFFFKRGLSCFSNVRMERNEQLQAKSGMYYSIVKIGGGVNEEYTFFFLCLKAASDRFIE